MGRLKWYSIHFVRRHTLGRGDDMCDFSGLPGMQTVKEEL
jgi:hypothetical protein